MWLGQTYEEVGRLEREQGVVRTTKGRARYSVMNTQTETIENGKVTSI